VGTRLGYKQTPEHVRLRIARRLATLRVKPKPVSREWLMTEYVERGLDCVAIGRALGRDPKTIWAWMRHYGIPTRPRGHDTSRLCRDGSSFRGKRHTPETRERLRAMALADGRVPFDPAVGPPYRGKRGAETPNWKGGVTPERQAFYGSPEWKRACRIVWHRADARCERCAKDHRAEGNRGTFHVHHIVSFRVRALRAEPTNLALLCRECHRFVHGKLNVAREFLGERQCP
jgi:hypothetical protein